MIGLSVRGADKVASRLRGAARDVRSAQELGVRRGTLLVDRALKLELSEKGGQDAFWGKTGSPGDGLAVRSGRTRASVASNVFRYGDRVVGVVGSKEAHLKQHESGATVPGTSPRGYARIPTAAAQTPSGVDRNAGRSIRDIPGAFLFTSRTGKLWAAVRADKRLELLYLLVKQVRLRARRIFERTASRQTSHVADAMRSEVSLVVRRANA